MGAAGALRIIPATPVHRTRLLDLMAEFYAESGFMLDRARGTTAFAELLADQRLGRAWLLQVGGRDAGYVVMTLGYGMEHGGLRATVDDLYVRPPFRRSGLGSGALAAVREACETLGVRSLHVEAGAQHDAAFALYRRVGFMPSDRRHLTLRLAAPTHVERQVPTARKGRAG